MKPRKPRKFWMMQSGFGYLCFKSKADIAYWRKNYGVGGLGYGPPFQVQEVIKPKKKKKRSR